MHSKQSTCVTVTLQGIDYHRHVDRAGEMNVRLIRAKQARNPLGTPGVEKTFLRGGQIFKLCPIFLIYVQNILPGGEKKFVAGASHYPWLRSWGNVMTAKPPTRLAQVRTSLSLLAESGCETC